MAGVLGASSAKADDWLRLYDAANESAKSIQDGIQERAQLIRQGKQPAKLSAGLRQRLGQLATLTDELEVKLDRDESREVSKQEKSRRRDMISILRMRRTQMAKQLANSLQSDKSELLGGSTSGPAGSRGGPSGQAGRPAQETEETVGLDAEGALQLQDRLMKEQDEELGLLSEHVGAVKNIAITINTELDEQNRILADVDSETEAVQSRMRFIRKQVVAVLKRGNNWRLLLIMVLVAAVLVYVVIASVRR